MKIRIWQAYASNNSGAYTLVGTFRNAEVAKEVAALLEEICAKEAAWSDTSKNGKPESEDPLTAFAREHGLSGHRDEYGEDWPAYGAPPEVVIAGGRVVIHCAYTLSLPAMFGELIYRRGGRVEVELEHTHNPLVALFSFWKYPQTDEVKAHLMAIEVEIDARCDARTSDVKEAPFAHARVWIDHSDGYRQLAVVFEDLVAGVAFVRDVCGRHDLLMDLKLSEPEDADEPLTPFLIRPPHHGNWRVALWSIGGDRIATMREVRAIADCSPAAARARVDAVPTEVLVDVSEASARAAAARLCAVGADAEAYVTRPRKSVK